MWIKVITIEVPLSPRAKRIGLLVGVGALMLLGGGVASAGPPWATGQPLTADDLNAIDKRIARLEAPHYLGPSNGSTDGLIRTGTDGDGYRAAKQMCKDAYPTHSNAHMCSYQELITYWQSGGQGVTAAGWVAGPAGLGDIANTNGAFYADCSGFTSHSSGQWGASVSSGLPVVRPCTFSQPVICCE